MKQNSLKRSLNFFKIIVIITILIISILPRSINANPIGVDRCNDMCPVPYEESSVYLKSEKIEVTFNDKAKVKASYTFKNDAENETDLTILLPFKSKPSNLKIYLNNEKIKYTWTKLPPHIRIRTTSYYYDMKDYNENSSAVTFNLLFNENESKTILVKYNRNYYGYDARDISYYSFIYIVSTARYWHHKIESAEFVFKVPKDRFDKMRTEGYQINSDDKYIIATKTFENTSFGNNEIKFEWTNVRNPSLFENRVVWLLLILITIAISLFVFHGIYLYRINRGHSKGRGYKEIQNSILYRQWMEYQVRRWR